MSGPIAQGDVMLIPTTDHVDGETIPPEGGRVILLRGEATGHHHSFGVANATLYRYRPDDMPSGLSVGLLVIDQNGARLEHQEHAPIDVPPGRYHVRRQREYDPIGELRLVAD